MPTCGTLGRHLEIASMLLACTSLWTGARPKAHFFHSAKISGVSKVLSENGPPCTMRSPTASMSSREWIHPFSGDVRVCRTNCTPVLWSGMSHSVLSALGNLVLIKDPADPIFSIPPAAMTEWSDMSYSLYLMDELPQLSNNTF